MNEDYTIDQLEKTFKEHAQIVIKTFNEQKEKYEIEYKCDYPFEDFNICEALHVICREINQVKRLSNALEKGVILPENWGVTLD